MNRLNYLLTIVLIVYNCMANTPVSLNVSGTRGTISSLTPPQRQYNASLEGATAESYEWTISGDVDSTSNGNAATITFTGNAPDDGSLPSASIKCKAKYRDADNNLKTLESDKINVKWFCCHLSTRIEGESIVLRDSEHTYNAKIYTNLPGSKTYSWSWYENGVKKTSQNENISINFQDITGNSITLNCKIGVGDIQLDAAPFVIDINDGNYILTASRKDYKINSQYEHYRTYTDDNAVYIHFNLDDDDFSAFDNKKDKYGYDCDQDEFKQNGNTLHLDDDLCEIEFNVILKEGIQIDITGIPITVSIPDSLRIWKTQERKNGDILVSPGETVTWNNANEILGKTFFVEGMTYDSEGDLVIQFISKTRCLKYKTCSAGQKANQPTGPERQQFKQKFSKLIDCEWGILRKNSDSYYNCIAFSVDPYLTAFHAVNFKNDDIRKYYLNLSKHNLPNYYPFWVHDKVSIRTFEPNINKDNFFVSCLLKIKEQQMPVFCQYIFDQYFTNCAISITPRYNNNGKFQGVELISSNVNFKIKLPEIIDYFNGCSSAEVKYMFFMNAFGNDFTANKLNENNINSFFQSDLWKNNNNNNNFATCNKTDADRKIVFYSKFHAARKASLLNTTEYLPPKNIPPDWIIFASKLGEGPVILHLDDQICGSNKDEYGIITKAYK